MAGVGLRLGSAAGRVVGVCVLACSAGSATAAPVLQNIYKFLANAQGVGAHGNYPDAPLILGPGGALLGTTPFGGHSGANCFAQSDCGVVFSLTPPTGRKGAWTERVIHAFTGAAGDGANPEWSGLTAAPAGKTAGMLYGVTYAGGTGSGVAYSLTPPKAGKSAWVEKILWQFPAGAGGANPIGEVAVGGDGSIYGVTGYGGTYDKGIAYQLLPPSPPSQKVWTEIVLHSFGGAGDASYPQGGLIIDKFGALYGSSNFGGSGGVGAIFELTPPPKGSSTWGERVIYGFCSQANCSDGTNPFANVTMDAQGALYGSSSSGGANNDGVVFKLTAPANGVLWTQTVLYNFCNAANCADGSGGGYSTPIMDSTGAIFGTTEYGGSGGGLAYRLTPPAGGAGLWSEAVLHAFDANKTIGWVPQAGLVADGSGILYGTTTAYNGGKCCGTVFKVTGAGYSP